MSQATVLKLYETVTITRLSPDYFRLSTFSVCVYLQIPDQVRVAPSSSDPKSKFYELINVSVHSFFCFCFFVLILYEQTLRLCSLISIR